MKALKQYDTVLNNEPWAKKHSAYVDKWMNSKVGDKTSVFTKFLEAKLKVLSDSVSSEPERAKKPSHKRSFDMERQVSVPLPYLKNRFFCFWKAIFWKRKSKQNVREFPPELVAKF